MTNILGYTELGDYPGYVSVNQDDNGDVKITVRSPPTIRQGVRVCGHTCMPGDPECNNYCNKHPDRSLPMPDHPEPCEYTDVGVTSSFTMPREKWDAWLDMVVLHRQMKLRHDR